MPGALESPLALQRLAQTGDYDALVALGAVIRGDTYHFEIVCNESASGVSSVALEFGIPIGNGILTCDTDAQAQARMDQKGFEAAQAALEMANLFRRSMTQTSPAGGARANWCCRASISGSSPATARASVRDDLVGEPRLPARRPAVLRRAVARRRRRLRRAARRRSRRTSTRKPAELSPIERAILVIGAWELRERLEIPYKVVINEAVELAKSYGGTDGHRFVNGVLDKFAADVRATEIAALHR